MKHEVIVASAGPCVIQSVVP